MLPRPSPTKARVRDCHHLRRPSFAVWASDRRPAPTKAIPRGTNFGTVSLFYLTQKARQLELGKFKFSCSVTSRLTASAWRLFQ